MSNLTKNQVARGVKIKLPKGFPFRKRLYHTPKPLEHFRNVTVRDWFGDNIYCTTGVISLWDLINAGIVKVEEQL